MADRPIIMTGPMVRATLDSRKTQLRCIAAIDDRKGPNIDQSPYGVPGDRLWVREAWRVCVAHSHGPSSCDCADVLVSYIADGSTRFVAEELVPSHWVIPSKGDLDPCKMPRWASRITLVVKSINIEQLQLATNKDARAEGLEEWEGDEPGDFLGSLREMWDSEHANCPGCLWNDDPWTWVATVDLVADLHP